MLRDLRSVKLRPSDRKRVDAIRSIFQSCAGVDWTDERWLHSVCRRYHEQLTELHVARARARKTNGLREMGITREQAAERVVERVREEEAAANDMGF